MMPCAFVLALASAGSSRPAKIAMIAMTTSSSIRVKPARCGRSRWSHRGVSVVGLLIKVKPFDDQDANLAIHWALKKTLSFSDRKVNCAFQRTRPGLNQERGGNGPAPCRSLHGHGRILGHPVHIQPGVTGGDVQLHRAGVLDRRVLDLGPLPLVDFRMAVGKGKAAGTVMES